MRRWKDKVLRKSKRVERVCLAGEYERAGKAGEGQESGGHVTELKDPAAA